MIVALMIGYTHIENRKQLSEINDPVKYYQERIDKITDDALYNEELDRKLNIIYSQLNTLQSDVTAIKRDVQ